MARIDESEEFGRDWDWFAVDLDGNIGHFTIAGLRALPETILRDQDAAERLIRYFDERATTTGFSVRATAEVDSGGWGTGGQERFIRSFAEMSSKGLFSFNTEMIHGPDARYHLVTRPDHPLRIEDVPDEIQKVLGRTRAVKTS